MKNKYIKYIVTVLLGLSLLSTPMSDIISPVSKAYADEAKITHLEANYDGEPVLIGEEIDKTKLTVTATFSDGETETVKDYTLVTAVVKEEGLNIMMVIYQGKTANFYVTGKKLDSIMAYYIGELLSIGNSVSKKDVQVYATFKDGSSGLLTNFELVNNEISKVGNNDVYVKCQNQLLKIQVIGIAPKEVTALYATYQGGPITVGNAVKPEDLVITAAYKDGSSETIHNYTLLPEVIGSTGTQTVVAHFRGKQVAFNVEGIYKEIKQISAKYTGSSVGVGYSVKPSDVEVTVTYTDGSTQVTDKFNLLGASITYVGYHVVTAEVEGHKAEFIVLGIAEQIIDFSNSSDFEVTNGSNTAKVSIAVPKNQEKKSITGKSLETATVTKLLSRAVRKSQFIAFEVEAADEDALELFPLTMKIAIPSEFELEYTSLYYTPNKKSVIGLMNADTLKPNFIVVEIHNPGTYILSYKKE